MRIKTAIGLATVAGALFSGTASADPPIAVCRNVGSVYSGCTYVHTDEPCVDGGGRIGDHARYMFYPCHF